MLDNQWWIFFNRLAMHEESSTRRKVDDDVHEGAVPAYLLDRENTTRAKVCCTCDLKSTDFCFPDTPFCL
jgi:hypothetical protein